MEGLRGVYQKVLKEGDDHNHHYARLPHKGQDWANNLIKNAFKPS